MRREIVLSTARWIDVQSPSSDELQRLGGTFALPPVLLEELAAPSARSRLDVYPEENIVYFVFSIPTTKRPGPDTEAEIDLVIAPSFLLTVHYEHIDPLHKLFKELEVAAATSQKKGLDGFDLARLVLLKLYSSVRHELAAIRADLEDIETRMYQGEEKAMVFALAHSARDLLNVRQSLEPHGVLWSHWEEQLPQIFAGEPALCEKARALTRRLRRSFEEVMIETKSLSSWLTELRETNNSLVFTKQNEVMKVLTTMAFITFPLTLISSIFGMNTDYLPFVGAKGDFWVIIGIMVMLTCVFFLYFWRKGWLR